MSIFILILNWIRYYMEECLQRLNKLLMKYWWKPSFLSHLCHIQTNQYIRQESCQGFFFLSYNAVYVIACINCKQDYAFQAPSLPTFLISVLCLKYEALPQIHVLFIWRFVLLAELSDLKMFVYGQYTKICLETLYILLLLDIFFMRGRFELINLENKRVLIPTNNDSLFLCTSNTSTSNAICNFFSLLPCKCNSHEN